MHHIKLAVFDFNRTIYDPDSDSLLPGALAILEKLSSKMPLVLYSKKGEGRDERISELGIKNYFRKIISVEKKSPQDILAVSRELGIKPENIVVIGDRIKSELAAGKAAGCLTIWLKKGKFASELPNDDSEKPDYTITDLSELESLLLK